MKTPSQSGGRGFGVRARIVKSIYLKEARETLRDRRTLFLLIVMPMIFYPLMLVLIAEVAASQASQIKQTEGVVAITGSALPPDAMARLEEEGGLSFEVVDNPKEALITGELQVWIEVQPDFQAQIDGGQSAPLTVHYNSVEPLSEAVRGRVFERLKGWKNAVLEERLKAKGLSQAFIEPLDYISKDAAPKARQLGSMASQFLPMLVLIFMVTGAFYPAIDLTAGEKERKTIQTLLTSPVRPLEVVCGKYLTVLTIALISGGINIASIILIIGHNVMMAGKNGGGVDFGVQEISAVDVGALCFVVLLLGLMFSALMMTIASLAESPKEAQNYLSPVYLICLMPVIIAQLPGIELTRTTAFIPVLNLALIMKEILVEGVVWDNLFLVTVSSLIITILVLALASRLFNREALIIGRGGASSFIKAAVRGARGARTPEPGEAMAFVAILFVLLYYLGSAVQSWSLMAGLLITLYAILLMPTLGVTFWRRYDFKAVFHLSKPPWRAVVGALLLGLTSYVWVSVGTELFHESFLPVPQEFIELMEKTFTMPEDPLSKFGVILVVALSPAICEEAVFRGWLLSSFRGRTSAVVAVVVTALFFGVFHLSIYRFLGTATLGLLMGYMVWHTRSIWPAVLFHLLNNTMSLLSPDLLPMLGVDVAADRVPVWLILASLTIGAVGIVLIHTSASDVQQTS